MTLKQARTAKRKSTKRSTLVSLTKEQKRAIANKAAQARGFYTGARYQDKADGDYRNLRRKVQTMFGTAGVKLFWCNMWLMVESDGYIHA